MSNYTTHAASFKATNINTRALDAKRIDTKKLFINGVPFDELQGKEKPNQAFFTFAFEPNPNAETDGYDGYYAIESAEAIFYEDENAYGEGYSEPKFQQHKVFIKGSETNGLLEDGIYAVIAINDNFIQCIGGNSLEDAMDAIYMINRASFALSEWKINSDKTVVYGLSLEQCMMNHQVFFNLNNEELQWIIKICEETDNMTELYGGLIEGVTEYFDFIISIPYYNPTHVQETSSTYSLRPQQTNLLEKFQEKFTKSHQKLDELKQQMLDKNAE